MTNSIITTPILIASYNASWRLAWLLKSPGALMRMVISWPIMTRIADKISKKYPRSVLVTISKGLNNKIIAEAIETAIPTIRNNNAPSCLSNIYVIVSP